MNSTSGWKTYAVGALVALNSILYTMGVYARLFSPPLDKQVSDAILAFLMGSGLMTIRHAIEKKTEETKQTVEASAIAVSGRLKTVEDSVADMATDKKLAMRNPFSGPFNTDVTPPQIG